MALPILTHWVVYTDFKYSFLTIASFHFRSEPRAEGLANNFSSSHFFTNTAVNAGVPYQNSHYARTWFASARYISIYYTLTHYSRFTSDYTLEVAAYNNNFSSLQPDGVLSPLFRLRAGHYIILVYHLDNAIRRNNAPLNFLSSWYTAIISTRLHARRSFSSQFHILLVVSTISLLTEVSYFSAF